MMKIKKYLMIIKETPATQIHIHGSPLKIVREMKEMAYLFPAEGTCEDYMDWVCENLEEWMGLSVEPLGQTPWQRAESFLEQMNDLGIISLEESEEEKQEEDEH